MLRRFAVPSALLIASSSHAADIPTRMDQIVRSYVAEKGYMGSVLVAQDGKILLNKGYGSASLEWNVPNTPTTKLVLQVAGAGTAENADVVHGTWSSGAHQQFQVVAVP
jgi:CubicO group peptidase (beta-lactamase class C family)